jgi:hypothetical protein
MARLYTYLLDSFSRPKMSARFFFLAMAALDGSCNPRQSHPFADTPHFFIFLPLTAAVFSPGADSNRNPTPSFFGSLLHPITNGRIDVARLPNRSHTLDAGDCSAARPFATLSTLPLLRFYRA